MSLEKMLEDLPKDCDVGSKKLSQGPYRNLGRLQASYRHNRWSGSGELCVDFCFNT